MRKLICRKILKIGVKYITHRTPTGYKGTLADIVFMNLYGCHRTTFSKFLSKGSFNINYTWHCIVRFGVGTIIENSPSETPIFTVYYDTIAEKTKPSSKAEHTIQQTGFYHSKL